MQKLQIPCVLLAGGKSSRLGCDKTQVPFGDCLLSEFVYNRVSNMFEAVYISTKDSKKFHFKAKFLVESSNIFAPIIGMIEAFKNIESSAIIFLSIDCPFISYESLKRIAASSAKIAYATDANKAHYLISKWHNSTLPLLELTLNAKNYALKHIVNACESEAISVSAKECININTIENYNEALNMLESRF